MSESYTESSLDVFEGAVREHRETIEALLARIQSLRETLTLQQIHELTDSSPEFGVLLAFREVSEGYNWLLDNLREKLARGMNLDARLLLESSVRRLALVVVERWELSI